MENAAKSLIGVGSWRGGMERSHDARSVRHREHNNTLAYLKQKIRTERNSGISSVTVTMGGVAVPKIWKGGNSSSDDPFASSRSM